MSKTDETRSALIAGASGLTGNYVMRALLRDDTYQKVTALVRRKIDYQHKQLQQEVVDFKHLSEMTHLFEVDDVFCCLGTTIKQAGSKEKFIKVDYTYPVEMARLAIDNDVKRFIVMSSIGANSDSTNFYLNTKGILEDSLKMFQFPNLIIVRPSILMGQRQSNRPLESVMTFFMRSISPILIGRLKRYRPILAKHVAWSMVYLAKTVSERETICESNELQRLYDDHH